MLLDDFYLFGKGKFFCFLFFKESYDIIPFEFEEEFDNKNFNGIYRFVVKYPQVEMTWMTYFITLYISFSLFYITE